MGSRSDGREYSGFRMEEGEKEVRERANINLKAGGTLAALARGASRKLRYKTKRIISNAGFAGWPKLMYIEMLACPLWTLVGNGGYEKWGLSNSSCEIENREMSRAVCKICCQLLFAIDNGLVPISGFALRGLQNTFNLSSREYGDSPYLAYESYPQVPAALSQLTATG